MYNAHVNGCYMHFSVGVGVGDGVGVGVGVGVHNNGDSVGAARSGAFGHCVTPLDGADLHKLQYALLNKTQNTKYKIQSQNTKCTITKYKIPQRDSSSWV